MRKLLSTVAISSLILTNTSAVEFAGSTALSGSSHNSVSGATNAVVAGGGDSSNSADANTATGDYSGVLGGYNNTVSSTADYGAILGGEDNSVGGSTGSDTSHSSIIGGSGNSISTAKYSTILGGQALTLQGDNSFGFNGSSSAETVSQANVGAFMNVDIGIGTVSPDYELDVNGDIQTNGHLWFTRGTNTWVALGSSNDFVLQSQDSNGQFILKQPMQVGYAYEVNMGSYDFEVAGDAIADAWDTTSDGRLKTDIVSLEAGLKAIRKLRPVTFFWDRVKLPNANNDKQVGFIAQEVKDIIPESVSGSEDTTYTFTNSVITAYNTKAIQELDKTNRKLKRQVKRLKEQLRTMNHNLEALMEAVYSK